VDQSVRIAEGVRVELWPDEEEPLTVMRGHAHMGKDGRRDGRPPQLWQRQRRWMILEAQGRVDSWQSAS